MSGRSNHEPTREMGWTINQPNLTGTERFELHGDPNGDWLLTGTVVARLDGHPLDCAYRIRTAPDWGTRSVAVALEWRRSLRQLHLTRDDHDRWTIHGRAVQDLDGCVDVDLGITPATNTLPIRRLDLGSGQQADIDVAWVDFPSLAVRRSHQTYIRISSSKWHYRSGTHAFELTVDDMGLVTTYGQGLWRRNDPAGSSSPPPSRT